MLPIVSAGDARRLLLDGLELLSDPARASSPARVAKLVRQMGFVQVDSIQRIERAHHLILGARLDSYRAMHLDKAAFDKRALFEHWTHDAAFVPIDWFHQWKPRFAKTEARLRTSRWFTYRLRDNADATIARVYERIVREGPLRCSDFERASDKPATGWWDWTPEKTALEFLWHTGRLAIRGRDRFQKIYDLTERVFPDCHGRVAPSDEEHIDWACREALNRLGVASPAELATFFDAIDIVEASKWCRDRLATKQIEEVMVQAEDGKSRKAFAVLDWRRVRRAPPAPDRMRLLAPFDPIIRDRKRALRLFNFDYRFEAFVPAPKRKYGYYVLPILEGEQLVGRLDPRHEREKERLIVEKMWWERGIKPTLARQRKLRQALEVLATQIGAREIRLSIR